MKKQRVRIVNETGTPLTTRIVDADTGEEIHGVTSFELKQDSVDVLEAILSVIVELDVTADAEVRRYRLNQDTGDLTLLENRPADAGDDEEAVA